MEHPRNIPHPRSQQEEVRIPPSTKQQIYTTSCGSHPTPSTRACCDNQVTPVNIMSSPGGPRRSSSSLSSSPFFSACGGGGGKSLKKVGQIITCTILHASFTKKLSLHPPSRARYGWHPWHAPGDIQPSPLRACYPSRTESAAQVEPAAGVDPTLAFSVHPCFCRCCW